MTTTSKPLRTRLGKVRGLGSAKNGTAHWMAQRATALCMIPLAVILLIGFMNSVVKGDYLSVTHYLNNPLVGGFFLLFLVAAFYHAALGIQVVIEDYLPAGALKFFSLAFSKFVAALFFIMGAVALIRLQLMDVPPHV